ncbi:MAG: hypothetical protein MI976_11090 [Pseudomonadales bacterium]|nr:hypothetical protein [Pseudomonadales bacterium]
MMKNALSNLCLGFLLALVVAGCSSITLYVDTPEADIVYTDVPQFSVRWEGGGSAEQFSASLNGFNITDRFTVDETSATLTDPSLISEMRHNKNLFIASQGSTRIERTFIMDLKGPQIQVLSTTETEGVNTYVEGIVSDPSGVASLSFSASNGQSGAITLNEDNTFSLDLAYADPNEVVFTATDNIGQTSTATFYRTADGALGNTLNFRADIDAFTVISEIAPDLIAELDLASMLVSDEPLAEINVLIGDIEVYIDDAAMSVPLVDIMAATQNGMDMDLDLQVEDLDLQLRMCFDPIIGFTICQEAFVESTALFADITIDLGADNDGNLTVADMVMDFDITGLDIGLNLFNVDGWGIGIPDILQPLTDAMINAFGNLFVDILRPLLDDILTAVLGEVPLGVTMSLQYPGEETPRTLDIGTFFNDITREGDELVMTMGLNNDITPHDVTDPLGIRTFGFGPAASLTTPGGIETNFAFSLSASFFNHLLHDIYKAGIINVDVPVASIGGKPAYARLVPNEPPHMSIEDYDLGMAELHIWNFSLLVEIQNDAEDPSAGFTTLFNATLDMDVPLTLSAAGDGTLGVELSNQLSMEISNLITNGNSASDALINGLIASASGPIVNGLSSALQQIELPAILGMKILPREIWADKENGTFIIAGDLELEEELPTIE